MMTKGQLDQEHLATEKRYDAVIINALNREL